MILHHFRYSCVLLRIFKAHLKLEPAAAPHARAEHAGAWIPVDVCGG